MTSDEVKRRSSATAESTVVAWVRGSAAHVTPSRAPISRTSLDCVALLPLRNAMAEPLTGDCLSAAKNDDDVVLSDGGEAVV